MSCNFGNKHYREILQVGLEQDYQFIGFDELNSLPIGQKACILRHDIDYMPEWAIRFGQIETELGIKSTYFFQICAKTYNLRESRTYHMVHKLREMGHTIGLHFDLTWKASIHWEEVPSVCEQEKSVFSAMTGIEPCDIVSIHNPHRFVDLILNRDIPGMHHTYEPAYFSSIKYLSDSQGWQEGCLCKIFASKANDVIQLLLHPYIWPNETTGDFISDVVRMITLRSDELTQYLLDFHPVCNRNAERLRKELAEFQGKINRVVP